MIKRVVFFQATAFNKRDYHRFGFDIIQKRGYTVEAWDFSPWLKPDYYKNYNPPDPIKFNGHKILNNVNQIKSAISQLSSSDVVCDPSSITREKFISDIIKRKGVKIGAFLLGLMPTNAKITVRIKNILVGLVNNPKQTVMKVLYKILGKTNSKIIGNNFHAVDFLITSGRAAENDRRYATNSNTTIIKAHAFDYDRYLEEERNFFHDDSEVGGAFTVFLDEDMPFHPDYLHLGIKPYCSADIYYLEINRFFTRYEQETGLQIVIAGHPRVDYKSRGNPYGNRPIISGKTVHLVKRSTHVLLHMSTSVNFAVLYQKPMIMIESDAYSQTLKNYINARGKALGVEPINISKPLPAQYNQPKLNEPRYSQYKEQYIKEPETPDKPIWEIFCDYLDTLNE